MRTIRIVYLLIALTFLFSFTVGPQTDQQEDLALIGTTWHYTSYGLENELDYNITFERNGRFSTDHTITGIDDWWVFKGGILEIHWNDDYSVGSCHYAGGNKMKGESENTLGTKWHFTLERVASTKKPQKRSCFAEFRYFHATRREVMNISLHRALPKKAITKYPSNAINHEKDSIPVRNRNGRFDER